MASEPSIRIRYRSINAKIAGIFSSRENVGAASADAISFTLPILDSGLKKSSDSSDTGNAGIHP